ncbi:MAG TPA: ATP-binding protein [Candidatus Saccharimonadales bacterium]|nr:ATP-binding protein [Candidatus Saccharimonadales bacterium]
MEALLIVGIIFVAALVVLGPVLFLQLRNRGRQQVMYERAVEFVPILIHLPPMSEDTEVNGRDVRDIVEENISKALTIYNIVASSIQKGFRHRWYGQRHCSFEVIGTKGFVRLYAAVPAEMLDVLKQAITSAYPTTRLEVTAEHNIFSEVGGVNSVAGGEFNLKESFAYPIATYQELKRDALQSILNALSNLEPEDGVGIQIMFRPADSSWRKTANTHASKKRKGDDKGVSASLLARQMVTALVKPPETKEGGEAPKKELSALEQSVLDAIDDKTRYAGFEVCIRVVASSNILQRSQTIINNIVASFSLFDSPGKNGFKYEPAKDSAKLAVDYLLRAFSNQKKRNIMNSVELATLFHFPDQKNIPTSQLSRQESKQVDGPRNMPDTGLLLGFNVFRGVKKPIRVALKDRQRHMYAVGQTGTGKSTFLENLALQDMVSGDGFAFVDPHGDTAERLLSMVPKERTEDVIYFCPSDMDYPMGLNLFEYKNPDQKDFLIQETINMLYKLYDPQHQGIMGPRYEHIFRNAALAVMADPEGGTFVDIPKLFRDPEFLKQKLQHVKDPNVLDYWQKEFPASQRSNEAGEVTSWFVSKFGAFLSNEMMRNIIGQTKSAFDLRNIMDNKKILLVNLSKGRTGELNSKLLGMVFVMQFQAAAMSRSDIVEEQRQDFCLYVDEFQNFSTESFATIMSEARKFHLNLIVANQFTTQLTEEIRDAVFGNIGTIVSFRIGQNDVESLGRYFNPAFDGDDLLRVPNGHAIVRTLIGGVPTQPFSMATLPPLGNPNPKLAEALKQLSAAKYGKPRAVVEKAIFDRLATKAPPPKPFQSPFGTPGQTGMPPGRPSFGAPPTAGFGAPAAGPAPLGPAGSGSFLDEWMAKQRAQVPPTMLSPARASLPPAEPGLQTFGAPPAFNLGSSGPSNFAAPTPAAAGDLSGTAPIGGAGNISSDQLDQQEIKDIAAEIKKDLKASPDAPGTDVTPQTAPLPVAKAPEPIKDEAVLHLGPKVKPAHGPAPEDTIFIDSEGKLQANEPKAGAEAPNQV